MNTLPMTRFPRRVFSPDETPSTGAESAVNEPATQPGLTGIDVPNSKADRPAIDASSNTERDRDTLVTLLALSTLKGIGHRSVGHIVTSLARPSDLWGMDDASLRESLEGLHARQQQILVTAIRADVIALMEAGEREYERLQERGVSILIGDAIPERLRALEDPPRMLFVEGNPEVLKMSPAVAIVGTRTPSDKGLEMTQLVARILGAYPIAVVSGLADGIDAEAHAATLKENLPNVAFLGHGLDITFPASTADLRKRIVHRGGAVVTEYLPRQVYQKSYFVERNRLQAGLADLVIPVEAKEKSGTAHTVRFAESTDRPLAGITWSGANGISDVIRRRGFPVFNLEERDGRMMLDHWVRSLFPDEEAAISSLGRVKRLLRSELELRKIRSGDLDDFQQWLVDLKREPRIQ